MRSQPKLVTIPGISGATLIEGTPVDVSMTSSPDTFGSTDPNSETAFPAAEPTLAELRDQAQLALTAGIVGAVLGPIGIVMGFLRMRRRN